MTTNSATWFYRAPEKTPFLLEERVRTTFWDERLGSLWLNAVQVESPIIMIGEFAQATVKMEWEPGQWLRLTLDQARPVLVQAVANILRRPATLTYTDPQGNLVWEWRIADADARWRELQGQPAYGQLRRL